MLKFLCTDNGIIGLRESMIYDLNAREYFSEIIFKFDFNI